MAYTAAVALLSKKSGPAGNRGNDCALLSNGVLSNKATASDVIVFILIRIWFHVLKRSKDILDLQQEL